MYHSQHASAANPDGESRMIRNTNEATRGTQKAFEEGLCAITQSPLKTFRSFETGRNGTVDFMSVNSAEFSEIS